MLLKVIKTDRRTDSVVMYNLTFMWPTPVRELYLICLNLLFFFFLTYLKSSLFYLLMRVCKNNFLLKKKIHIKELMCSVLISNLRRSKGWICTHAYYVFIQSYVHVDVLVTKIHLVPMSNFFIFLNHAAIILLLPIFECTHRVLYVHV